MGHAHPYIPSSSSGSGSNGSGNTGSYSNPYSSFGNAGSTPSGSAGFVPTGGTGSSTSGTKPAVPALSGNLPGANASSTPSLTQVPYKKKSPPKDVVISGIDASEFAGLTVNNIPSFNNLDKLSESQIRSLTKEQLQAFSADQILALSYPHLQGLAREGGKASLRDLTDDQTLALAKAGTFFLMDSRTNLTASEKLNAFSPSQIDLLFGDSPVLPLSSLVFGKLPEIVFQAYSRFDGAKPNIYTAQDVQKLTPAMLSFYENSNEHRNLERDLFLQIEHVSAEQVQAINPMYMMQFYTIPWMKPERVADLTLAQIRTLGDRVNWMTAEQVQSLSDEQKDYFNSNPGKLEFQFVKNLFPEMTWDFVSALSFKDIQDLQDPNADLGILRNKAVLGQASALHPLAIPALNKAQIEMIPVTEFSNFDEFQLAAFSGQQISFLPKEALGSKGFPTRVVLAQRGQFFASLGQGQLEELSGDYFKRTGLSQAQLQAISVSQIQGMSDDQAKKFFKSETIKNASQTQIQALSKSQLKAITSDHFANQELLNLNFLSDSQVSEMDPDTLKTHYSASSVTRMAINQFKLLSAEQLDALGNDYFTRKAILKAQIQSIPVKTLRTLDEKTVKNLFSYDHLQELSQVQVGALKGKQLNAILSTHPINGHFSKEQLTWLSTNQISRITELRNFLKNQTVVDNLSDSQLRALNVEALKSFSDSWTKKALKKRNVLSAEQLKALKN